MKNVKFKQLLSLLMVLLLCTSATTAFADTPLRDDYPQRFHDVPKSHWAFKYIADLEDRGIINGYPDGSFRPSATVTRAEWAKIMVCAADLRPNDNSVYFTDTANHWAIAYVNAAREYLTGYPNSIYRPNQAAVREDVTVALVRLKGCDTSKVDYSCLEKFTDNNSISNNIKAYVATAVEVGLIQGFDDNTFRGQATLTRAEAATLLWRAFTEIGDCSGGKTPLVNPPFETPSAPINPEELKTPTTPKPETPQTPVNVSVTGVTLSKNESTLVEGKTENLTATITPANATNKRVTWSSNQTSIASVSSIGVVTAIKEGRATITAKTEDGGRTAQCVINVIAKTEPDGEERLVLGSDIKAYQCSDMDEFNGSSSFKMAGASYIYGIVKNSWYGNGVIYYNLKGQYTHFVAIYGPIDNNLSSNSTINIYGDSLLLKELTSIAGTMPKFIEVNISGVQQLKIEISGGPAALAQALAAKKPVEVVPNSPIGTFSSSASLGSDIKAYQKGGSISEYPEKGTFRLAGTSYNSGLTINRNPSAAYYNIDGRYTNLSGLYGPVDGTTSSSVDIIIYGDGKPLIELTSDAGAMPKEFSVSVAELKQLKIEFSSSYVIGTHALANLLVE